MSLTSAIDSGPGDACTDVDADPDVNIGAGGSMGQGNARVSMSCEASTSWGVPVDNGDSVIESDNSNGPASSGLCVVMLIQRH